MKIQPADNPARDAKRAAIESACNELMTITHAVAIDMCDAQDVHGVWQMMQQQQTLRRLADRMIRLINN